jgi:hypothetical protein
MSAPDVYQAISAAKEVFERNDLSTYNVVITCVYSEPDEEENK